MTMGGAVEAALWTALEALEERAEFLRRLAARHAQRRPHMHECYESTATDALARAELIRRALGTRADRPDALDVIGDAAVSE